MPVGAIAVTMKLSLVALGFLSLASEVYARSTSHLSPVEALHTVPDGWKEIGKPVATRRLHFRIAVNQVSITKNMKFKYLRNHCNRGIWLLNC